jgi:hypothetical protein
MYFDKEYILAHSKNMNFEKCKTMYNLGWSE